jgi:hypothetical protein
MESLSTTKKMLHDTPQRKAFTHLSMATQTDKAHKLHKKSSLPNTLFLEYYNIINTTKKIQKKQNIYIQNSLNKYIKTLLQHPTQKTKKYFQYSKKEGEISEKKKKNQNYQK